MDAPLRFVGKDVFHQISIPDFACPEVDLEGLDFKGREGQPVPELTEQIQRCLSPSAPWLKKPNYNTSPGFGLLQRTDDYGGIRKRDKWAQRSSSFAVREARDHEWGLIKRLRGALEAAQDGPSFTDDEAESELMFTHIEIRLGVFLAGNWPAGNRMIRIQGAPQQIQPDFARRGAQGICTVIEDSECGRPGGPG